MKPAALGIRMHSGWGVSVAVDKNAAVLDRRRMVVTNRDGPRGRQPYHYAQGIGFAQAEKFLADYADETCRLAEAEIQNVIAELSTRGYRVAAASVLLASGRKLPPLPQILAAHPLIHSAEGELFRDVIRRACESLSIPVLDIREREIETRARDTFAASAPKLIDQLAKAGKSMGPPWNADHKCAALAACIALRWKRKKAASNRL